LLKEIVDAWTDAQTHGRTTDNGPSQMLTLSTLSTGEPNSSNTNTLLAVLKAGTIQVSVCTLWTVNRMQIVFKP